MLLAELVELSSRVSATASRQEKIQLLTNWLRRLGSDEISIGVHYLSGRLPQGRIGIGGSVLDVARHMPSAPIPQTLGDVDRVFRELAQAVGTGSSAVRRRQLMDLFARCTPTERDFLARLIVGELRQGALEGIMVEALARAASIPAEDVRRAMMVAGDFGGVAQAALAEGAEGLARFRLQLLQPLRPMLAQPADDAADALAQLGEAALEYKMDGARLQVHKADGEVRVYSRRLNDVTASVPELVETVRALPASRLILDGEAIALAADGRPLAFQTTMRRFGRKQEVDRLRADIPLSAFYFDCLHYEGEDLIARSTAERFRALADAVPADVIIPRRVSSDPEVAAAFMREALARGHEGILAKSLAAPYEAGNRGSAWLKIKSAHTLDLVVLAAEWGHGRRQGWLSNLHLGARDPAGGPFVMLGKTFKGMTDQMLAWQTKRLLELAVSRDAYTVYVRPALVVEIAFNGILASPQYPGGLALRFARVKRYREDKRPEDADTIDTVRALYQREAGEPAVGR